jgi:hypothetical protein
MQRAICRGIFAPAQPDFLAASVRDFLSGAYSLRREDGDRTRFLARQTLDMLLTLGAGQVASGPVRA